MNKEAKYVLEKRTSDIGGSPIGHNYSDYSNMLSILLKIKRYKKTEESEFYITFENTVMAEGIKTEVYTSYFTYLLSDFNSKPDKQLLKKIVFKAFTLHKKGFTKTSYANFEESRILLKKPKYANFERELTWQFKATYIDVITKNYIPAKNIFEALEYNNKKKE